MTVKLETLRGSISKGRDLLPLASPLVNIMDGLKVFMNPQYLSSKYIKLYAFGLGIQLYPSGSHANVYRLLN